MRKPGIAAGIAGAGFVIVARRLESVAPLVPGPSDRPGIVFLDQGKAMVSTLPVPATEWAKAAATGRVRLEDGRDFLVWPAEPGRLWLLVADGRASRLGSSRRLEGAGVCHELRRSHGVVEG